MSTKDLLSLSMIVAVVVLLYKCYNFHTPQEQVFLAGIPNLHISWSLKTDMTKSEICMGRRCASMFQQNESNVDFLISTVILSLIGLAIHLTVKNQRVITAAGCSTRKKNGRGRIRAATEAFKPTAHSSSIACSSLSSSPVPLQDRLLMQNRPESNKKYGNIPWDQMAKSSDFEVCLSLHPSPLPSNCSFMNSSSNEPNSHSSSSNSGLYPCTPPRRWLGNSRLNLATSPEVVPREVDLYYHL